LCKSKKQDGMTRSSVEVEYRAIALVTCELRCIATLQRA